MEPGAPDEFVQLGNVRVAWDDVQALLVALTNRRPLTADQARVARAIVGTWSDSAAWTHPPRRGRRPDPPLRVPAPAVLFAGGPLAGIVMAIERPTALLCGLHAPALLQHLSAQAKLHGQRLCLPYARDPAAPADAARVLYRFKPDRGPEAEDDCRRRVVG